MYVTQQGLTWRRLAGSEFACFVLVSSQTFSDHFFGTKNDHRRKKRNKERIEDRQTDRQTERQREKKRESEREKERVSK